MAADTLPSSAKIAIVGIGCRFANGINDTEDFKRMLCDGLDCTSAPPDGRYDMKQFYSYKKSPGKMYNQRGGYIKDDLFAFDREFFRISPEEANSMDPQVRLLLEVTHESFENAGIPTHKLKGTNTGVYMGVTSHEYILLTGIPVDNISQYTNSGTNSCMVANRLSYEFDLRGPSFSVDTACSSSLYAIHLACEAIRQGSCDMAIAGGVNLLLTPMISIGFSQAGMLSPDGRCKSFDNSADGYSRSDGAGVVVLKPLERAIEDGDNIYAVIRGGALSNDGRTPGIANPSYEAQADLVHRACRHGQVHPHKIQYIEAHGTGTIVGDRTEANALGEALSKTRSKEDPKLFIGSVKSNFGHTEGAAGVAGIIKVALMLFHKIIPPVVHFKNPNKTIPFEELNMDVPTKVVAWKQPTDGQQRLAGCSSFGFGGANAHLILEEPPATNPSHPERNEQHTVLLLSAGTSDAFAYRKLKTIDVLKSKQPSQEIYQDMTATSFHRSTHHRYRCGVIAKSATDAITALTSKDQDNVIEGTATNPESLSGVVFVFTGMGSQWWAMGRSLFFEDNVFRQTIKEFDKEMLTVGSSWSMSDLLTQTENKTLVNRTDYAQPAICAVQIGIVHVLREHGVSPDAVIGHSVGEVAAAYASRKIDFKDAVRLIYYRGLELSKTSGKGKMLAVLNPVVEVRSEMEYSECRHSIDIAAFNSPTQTVLSGDSDAIMEFKAHLEKRGIRAVLLTVNNAFHSFQQDVLEGSLKEKFSFLAEKSDYLSNDLPMVSSVTGAYVSTTQLNDGEYWWNNVRCSVNFQGAFELLFRDGYTTFVEVGAHPALGPAMRDIIQAKKQQLSKVRIYGTLKRPKDTSKAANDQHSMLQCLMKLHCDGYKVDFSRLYPEQFHVQPLALYPWQRVACSAITSEASNRLLHPRKNHNLLGDKEDASDLTEVKHVWNSELSVQTVPWIREHIIQSNIIAPGTSYLETFLEAAKQLQGKENSVCSVNDIDIRKFLFMPDCKATLRTIVVRESDCLKMSIMSKGSKNLWAAHATANLCLTSNVNDVTKLDIQHIRSRCMGTESNDTDFLYTNFTEVGYSLGPSFRNVTHSWFSEDLNIGYLRISASHEITHELDSFNAHPALLDSCWQGLGCMMMLIKKRRAHSAKVAYKPRLLVPLSVSEMVLFRPLCGEHFVKIEVQSTEPLTADITVTDIYGVVCFVLRGSVFGAASEADVSKDIQLWNFDTREIIVDTSHQLPNNTGILAVYGNPTDERSLSSILTNGMRLETASIANLQSRNYDILTKHSEVKHIVVLSTYENMADNSTICSQTEIKCTITNSLVTLTKIVKQLKQSNQPKPTLWLLTRGASTEGPMCSPIACAIQSFGISMMHEAIEIKVYMVALPQDHSDFHVCLPVVRNLIANPPPTDNEIIISCSNGVPRICALRLDHFVPRALLQECRSDQWAIEDDMKSQTVQLVSFSNVGQRQNHQVRISVKAFKLLSAVNKNAFRAIVAGPVLTKCNGYNVGDVLVGYTASSVFAIMDLDEPFCTKIPKTMEYAVAVVVVHRYLLPYVITTTLNVRQQACLLLSENSDEALYFQDVIEILGGHIPQERNAPIDVIISITSKHEHIPSFELKRLKCFGKIVSLLDSDSRDNSNTQSRLAEKGFSNVITVSKTLHQSDSISKNLGDFMSRMLKEIAKCVSQKTFRSSALQNNIIKNECDVITTTDVNINVRLQIRGNNFRANPSASYVVVGASKGFGIEVLQWLVRSGAKNIIAVSRNPPNDDDEKNMHQMDNLVESVTWYQANIANYSEVLKALKCAKLPIEGIFHAAAVYQDSWLDNLGESEWHAVFMPKAYGAYLLHQAAKELRLPLKYFVMFSSLTGLVGSAGQANYTAANSFLLGLGSLRRSQGLPATVASMGVINRIGFAARNDLVETWENKGVGSLSPEQTLDIIGMMMVLDIPHLGMTGYFNKIDYYTHSKPQMKEHLREKEGTFSRWKTIFTHEILEEGNKGVSQSLIGESPSAAKNIIQNELVSFLAQKLGVADPETITLDRAPVAFGMDSLMAPDLSSHISELFAINVLPVDLLNDKNTIGKLVASIYEKVMTHDKGTTNNVVASSDATPLLVATSLVTNPDSLLICFPPVGGGPSTFFGWNTWAHQRNIQIYVVQFPGWEGSIDSKPISNFNDIISSTTEEVAKVVSNERFNMYGHSFGALIAYEVAHSLNSKHGVVPNELFLGAWYSPMDPYPDNEDIPSEIFDEGTSIEKAIEMAQRFKFLDKDVLQNKHIMKRMLPCIDVSQSILRLYKHKHANRLPCDMSVYAGSADRFLQTEDVKRWENVANPGHKFNFNVLKGRHLFILDKACRQVITDDIASSFDKEMAQI